MAERTEGSNIQTSELPYFPGWVDRLIAWIDRIRVPPWLFYVLSTLAIALVGNSLFWIDGSLPLGSTDPNITLFALIVFYWLALYHYLTRVGSRSLQSFRRLLEADSSEIARIEYELATLPSWLGWLTIPLGVGFAATSDLTETAPFGDLIPKTALPYIGDIAITGFLVATFCCVVIRSIRQLRMVHRLHTKATNINLLDLDPAHAFSALTARTAIGFILIPIVGYFMDPEPFNTPLELFTTAGTFLLAIAVFVVPIMGMRDHIEEEKHRVLDHVNVLLQTTSDKFHSMVERADYRDLEGMETAIATLIRERELVERISTWPWDAGTIRGFATTLLLPIFLLVIARLIDRFF